MEALLIQLNAVLTSDTDLTAEVPSDNIGASIRQNAGSPVLEYGIDGEESDHSGHRFVVLAFGIYSAAGAAQVYRIKELLERLLTAKNLSTPVPPSLTPLTFRVAQVKLTDARVYPRDPWAHSLRVEFTVQVSDLRPPTQKQ